MSSISLASTLLKKLRKREQVATTTRHTRTIRLLPHGKYFGGKILADLDFDPNQPETWLIEWQYIIRKAYLNKTMKRGILCAGWHRLSEFYNWWQQHYIPGRKVFWTPVDNSCAIPLYSPETAIWLTPEAEEMFYSIPYNKSISKSQLSGAIFLRGRWVSRIKVAGKQKRLGVYDTPEEAHRRWQKDRLERLKAFELAETDLQTRDYYKSRHLELQKLYKRKLPFDHV